MAAYLKLINYDGIFTRLLSDKIVINNIDVFNTETKELLDNIIMMNYSEDNISIIPSCKCGELKGEYYVGDVCPRPGCNTTVTNSLDDAISFLLWAEAPKDVELFISPIVMIFLINRYKITKPSVKLIEYIMLPGLKIERKQARNNLHLLEKLDFLLKQNNIERGYNSFVRNFFKIIEILEAEFVKKKHVEGEFLNFLLSNKDNIFSRYLPFPNRIIFATESNELGRFIDKSILSPINVIRRLTGVDLHTKPGAVKQAKVAKSLLELAPFYEGYLKTSVFAKPGLIRQHITSNRSHFTARAVIVSIEGIHQDDEVYLPWSVSCSLFRPYILNGLYRKGYTYKTALGLLIPSIRVYNQVIADIFDDMIAASNGGIRALFSRNPLLHRGSMQAVRVTRVKKDPYDTTISMSDRIGPSFNSDHDGKLVAVD